MIKFIYRMILFRLVPYLPNINHFRGVVEFLGELFPLNFFSVHFAYFLQRILCVTHRIVVVNAYF